MRRTEAALGFLAPGLLAVLAVLSAGDAAGHAVRVRHGTVEVARDGVVIELAAEPGELLVRDGTGELIPIATTVILEGPPAAAAHAHADHVTRRFVHRTATPPLHVTFQLDPKRQHRALAQRVVLAVSTPGDGASRTVHLTSGGNAETLELRWDGDPSADTVDGLHEVRVTVHFSESGVEADVLVPLVLLETWARVPRARVDVLAVAEQVAATGPLARFFDERVQLEVDGAVVQPEVDVTFVGLLPADTPAPLSSWTARAHASLRAEVDGSHELKLTWRLFNAAVLTADLRTTVDGEEHQHRLSTYEPTVTLTR